MVRQIVTTFLPKAAQVAIDTYAVPIRSLPSNKRTLGLVLPWVGVVGLGAVWMVQVHTPFNFFILLEYFLRHSPTSLLTPRPPRSPLAGWRASSRAPQRRRQSKVCLQSSCGSILPTT